MPVKFYIYNIIFCYSYKIITIRISFQYIQTILKYSVLLTYSNLTINCFENVLFILKFRIDKNKNKNIL